MFGADACFSPRLNLESVSQVASKLVHFLVVNVIDVVDAK